MDLDHVEELVPAATASWRPGDSWLAGGTWLFSERQPAVRRLLDLTAFGWPSLTATPDGLLLGATCTLAELAGWQPPSHWSGAALVGQCCTALLGSFKVWNCATVGGNLCLSLPASPIAALTVALDGRCTLLRPDTGASRTMPVHEFVTGPGSNRLQPGELLRSVWLPAAALTGRTAFRQISLSPHGRSGAVVIGRRGTDGELALTVTAATVRPVEVRFAGRPDPEHAWQRLDAAVPAYHDDVHGDPRWRRAMTRRFVLDVLEELAQP
ncbi:MAG TPA: FAD binding domain-containing protein [Jatrophihabitans sp.]|nr:FAD binding domain-containing protein [Jatrophihabitans sp.]